MMAAASALSMSAATRPMAAAIAGKAPAKGLRLNDFRRPVLGQRSAMWGHSLRCPVQQARSDRAASSSVVHAAGSPKLPSGCPPCSADDLQAMRRYLGDDADPLIATADVALRVGSRVLLAHKGTLVQQSNVLRDVLLGVEGEQQQQQQQQQAAFTTLAACFEGIAAEDLVRFLEPIYSSEQTKVLQGMSAGRLLSVHALAVQFGAPGLQRACVQVVMDRFDSGALPMEASADSPCSVYRWAAFAACGEQRLQAACELFVTMHFAELQDSPLLDELPPASLARVARKLHSAQEISSLRPDQVAALLRNEPPSAVQALAAAAQTADFVGEYEWTVPSASKLQYMTNMDSPEFVIGGCTWNLQLLVFTSGGVSVRVWPGDPWKLPEAWHRDVPSLRVVLVNQADASKSRSHGFGAVTFCARDKTADWDDAPTLRELLDPAAGWLLNDTLRVKVVFGGGGDEDGGGGGEGDSNVQSAQEISLLCPDQVEFVGECEWTVPSASNLKYTDLTQSPKFVIGGCTWTLRLFVHNNGDVSVSVSAADTYSLPVAWHRDVPGLRVVVVNQADASRSRSHGFGAVTFCARETYVSWHYGPKLKQLLDPVAGWLVDDTLRVKVVFGGGGGKDGGGGGENILKNIFPFL